MKGLLPHMMPIMVLDLPTFVRKRHRSLLKFNALSKQDELDPETLVTDCSQFDRQIRSL